MSAYRLHGRLAALERRVPGAGACPSCTRPAGAPVRIVRHEEGDPEPAPCPQCGRKPLSFTLRLDHPAGPMRP